GGGHVGLLADDEGTVTLYFQRADLLGRDGFRLLLRGVRAGPVQGRRTRDVVGDLGGRDPACATSREALVVLLAQPGVQLFRRQVERRIGVARRGLRPDHRTAGAQGDLHPVAAVGLSGVGL